VIKNAFAPLFQGRFDYVMGNPPWVNWESLPEEYRSSTVDLWQHHGLFPHKGMDAILGKGKKDISMLMTYVAMDDYLKDKGRLGFLITQSVFKTAGAGQGFRRFRLGSGTPIRVVAVDDMSRLKPFEGASNRTAIVVLERGQRTEYPVRSYSLWFKPGGGSVIPEDVSLEEVESGKVATYSAFHAQPVDIADPTSPWMTGRGHALSAVSSVLGRSDYVAKTGVCTWLNGVYWLEIQGSRPPGIVVVRNLTEGAKIQVRETQAAVEQDLVYPLLRGRDISRWQACPSAHILMVQDPVKRRGYDEEWLAARYPNAYRYLKQFEAELRQRSGYKRYFDEGDPFYSMFDVGQYSFADYKVVWTRVAKDISGAVVGRAGALGTAKPVVPAETAVLVAFDEETEAHYLCAALNSRAWRFVIVSTAVHGTGGFGSPNVLQKARIPMYDPGCAVHARLSSLSREAHQATAAGDEARVKEIEEEIDQLAAQIWGLTDKELADIKRSLEELL